MRTAKRSGGYKRRQWIVNPSFQYRFIGIMLLVLLLLTVGALGSLYLAIWVTLRTFEISNEPLAVAQLTTAGLVMTAELLLIVPVIVWIGIRLTHKVAGPLVRINAVLQQMASGDFNVHLKLRKGDSLIELAEAINVLAEALRSGSASRLPRALDATPTHRV